MGPVAKGTCIPKNKKVILIGYGLRNMALLPIAQAIKDNNNEVIFFAHYAKPEDRIYAKKIENIADKVIWSSDSYLLKKNRDQDESIISDITKSLSKFNYIYDHRDIMICYGPNEILIKIKNFISNNNVICNLITPMQCMMQGICGQCIQQINNQDYIFGCTKIECNLKEFNPQIAINRLEQNSLLENHGNRIKNCV